MDFVKTLLSLKKLKKMHFFVTDVQHQLYPKTTSCKIVIDRCNQFCDVEPT